MLRVSCVLLSTCLLLPAQGEPGGTAAQGGPNEFVRVLGEPGSRGALRIEFDRRGAGIWSIRLLDHYVSRAAGRKAEHQPADYELLVSDVVPGNLSLVLQQDARSNLFPQRLDGVDGTAWQREDLPDGVRFELASGTGLVLQKTFRHRPEHRGLELELGLRNDGDAAAPGNLLQLVLVGPSLVNSKDVTLFGNPAVAIGRAVGVEDGPAPIHPAKGAPVARLLTLDGRELSFVGATNRFFAAFLYPLDTASATAIAAVDVGSIPRVDDPRTETSAGWVARALHDVRLQVPAVGQATTLRFGLYLGPKSFRVFDEQPEHARFLPIMDVDLEPPCCITVPGGRFMATLLLKLLGWFESVVGNWGIAIMMLTLLVRGALAPLNFRMQKSMRGYATRMAVLKPKMDKLKQQYQDDPKGYQAAMIQFQREHKIMPPLGGCLPIFLTMPIYLGLFGALRVAYDLRQQPFLGPLPWIEDLSRPDALFELGLDLGLFTVPYFNLLPLVWIGMFLWLQLKTPLPTDPQQRQMQLIMRFMPVLFGLALYNYASGLMVYMVTSMIWTMFESAVTKKILGPLDPNVQSMAPTPVM